jgi:hypothetical protein
MRSPEDMEHARRMLERGANDHEISRATGVPSNTVGRWRRGATAAFIAPPIVRPWRPPDDHAYAYLLGLYLGDGCVSVASRKRVMFRVALDEAYPGVIAECEAAMRLVMPSSACRTYARRGANAVTAQASGPLWLEAFPQHGPGRKHERRIEFVDWQRNIVDRFPREFLRGLIHSDGCRTVNRFKTKLPSGRVAEYAYARYFFSNLSADIRGLFCEYCGRLGIRWTQSNPRNISVSHRDSVALLDAFVGPKR